MTFLQCRVDLWTLVRASIQHLIFSGHSTQDTGFLELALFSVYFYFKIEHY